MARTNQSNDFKMMNNSNRCFVAFIPSANSNSSNRVKAAAEAHLLDAPQSNNRVKRWRKKNNKLNKQLCRVKPNQKCKIDEDSLNNHIVFADGGERGSGTIPQNELHLERPLKILSIANGDLFTPKIMSTDKGLTTNLDGKPIYILCPRSRTLQITKLDKFGADGLIGAYEGMISMSNKYSRGSDIIIESDYKSKYVCVGSAARRGGRGICRVHHGLKKISTTQQEILLRHLKQVETLFEEFMPTDAICQVKKAIKVVNAPLFTTTEGETSNIYQAIAVGKSIFISAHKDKDFTFSAVTALKRGPITIKDEAIVYFNFPRLGLAIPLAPGDVLFFDPSEYHMISSRCKKEDEIYCISFYLKSNLIGGNDNSKALNNEQDECLRHHIARTNK